MTSCSRRAVCQASASSILKISGHRQCSLLAVKGGWDCTALAKFDIYNCLVVVEKVSLMLMKNLCTYFSIVVTHFYPCCASAVLAVIVCLFVCLSVTHQYCTKVAKRRITDTMPYDSPGTLVFGHQQSLVGDAPFP